MLTSRIRTMKEIVRNRDCLYSVNNYQRFYVWDDNKVNTYLSDILKIIGQAQSTPVIPKHFFVFGNGDNSGLENSPYEQKREVYRTSRFVSANDVALTNEHWTIMEFQNRHNNVCNKLSRLLLRFYE